MSLLLLLVLLLHSRPAAADSCDWPIDLTLERDGHYMDREAAGAGSMTRGRAGNAMIQSITARLAAAAYGGYSTPWDGHLKMKWDRTTAPPRNRIGRIARRGIQPAIRRF